MSTLRGIVVHLSTGTHPQAGTDDALYVGVAGTAGGREFPLDVAWVDDFERRSRAKYALGSVWEESALAGAKVPKGASGDWNDPQLFFVGFDAIDRVYLRKHCAKRGGTDDAYQLDEITVTLYADDDAKRTFRCSSAIWLGVEYGAQVWLPEVSGDELSVSLRT